MSGPARGWMAMICLWLSLALPAHAAPSRVNQHGGADQWLPDIASAADGRFVVVWQSEGQDGSLTGIYARRFGADGAALGPEFRVNSTTTNRQSRPAVAMSPDGRFAVAWDSEIATGLAVMLRVYAADGTPVGPEIRVDDGRHVVQPQVDLAMDGDGNVALVWQERVPLTGLGLFDQRAIRLRRFAAGSLDAGRVQLVHADRLNVLRFPRIAMNADGRTVVAWLKDDAATRIQARAYGGLHSTLQRIFVVNQSALRVDRPDLAVAPDGSFMVAWDSFGEDYVPRGARGRAYDANGKPLAGEFAIDPALQRHAALAVDSDGRFAVAAHGDGVYLQCLQASGPLAPARRVDEGTSASHTQLLPRLAPLAGGWRLAWQGWDRDQDRGRDVFVDGAACT